MPSYKQRMKATPGLRRAVGFSIRTREVGAALLRHSAASLRWLLSSREITNFSYALSPLSLHQLAALLADMTGRPFPLIQSYFHELDSDQQLRAHLHARHDASPDRVFADRDPLYCRRVGWYAVVRLLKPRVVVETGVDKGMGTCVLAAALLRNRAEGHPGRVFGTDINPAAGYLLSGVYREVAEILYGDSLASLAAFSEPIDVFINDSDHSAEYEAREYAAIERLLTPSSVILADNAHVTDKLREFATARHLSFVFWREEPVRHWYRGGGIGFAFRRDALAQLLASRSAP